MAYVYRHIRLDTNQPFYIGIGTNPNFKRASANSPTSRNDIWHKIAKKTSFNVEIILDGLSLEDALKKEVEFIKLYGRKNNNTGTLANLTDGGEGQFGRVCSDESKLKMSNAQLGKKRSEQHKANIKKAMLKPGVLDRQKLANSINPKRLGILHTEASKLKMSQNKKGILYSQETKDKMSKSHMGNTNTLGRKLSQEHKDKISKSLLGNKRASNN